MTDLRPEDKRRHFRHPLTGDLTGRIVSAQSGSVIPCMAVDVSVSGLKIVLLLDLAPGTGLFLKLANQEIPLTVVWCSKEPSRKGYFACGLTTTMPGYDLLRLFGDGGEIK